MPYKVKMAQNGSPQYKNIDIQYQTHSSREALKSNESKKVQLIDYSAEGNSDSTSKQWTKSSLRIQYPHPEGKKGMALATLTMSQSSFNSLHYPQKTDSPDNNKSEKKKLPVNLSNDSDTSVINKEIWKCEFSKEQIDLLLMDLSKSGYFDEQTRPNGKASISIQIDKGTLSKNWTQDPRLEDIINRIFEKGWLDCYHTDCSI